MMRKLRAFLCGPRGAHRVVLVAVGVPQDLTYFTMT